ncbi:MAG: sigma 54-interacting transcriptional regulator, partial [Marinoscillum sp.]
SHRKHGQFIAINCGAIPEGTIDSELFGHEKGSFTGAHESRKGYFEVTNGGTIFLDEIGEMPVSTQARLLRVLENGEFIKVGSSKVQKTDVRVIAATNVDLTEAIDKGKFREDLYYRLNTVPIKVPSLRERGEDVALLFKKFAADFSETYRTKPIILDDEAKEILMKFRFPGNIRQLKNLVEQISVLELDREITGEKLLSYLPKTTSYLPALVGKNSDKENFSERDLLYKVLFDMKKDMSEMKTLIHKIISEDSPRSEILSDHKRLFTDMESFPSESDVEDPAPTPVKPIMLESRNQEQNDDSSYDIEDITHETEDDESLSLEKKEKEMIVMALKKNNNKRKYAARDLGISERTLYRKIKQYEIDN